jgi:methionyl-tRNA synthetase
VADEAGTAWDDARPSDALAATWRLVAATNAHLVAAAPWKQPPGSAAAADALGDALEALRIAALLASPAIPSAAAEICRRIGASGLFDAAWGSSLAGGRVTAGPPLFPRLRPAAAPPAGGAGA